MTKEHEIILVSRQPITDEEYDSYLTALGKRGISFGGGQKDLEIVGTISFAKDSKKNLVDEFMNAIDDSELVLRSIEVI